MHLANHTGCCCRSINWVASIKSIITMHSSTLAALCLLLVLSSSSSFISCSASRLPNFQSIVANLLTPPLRWSSHKQLDHKQQTSAHVQHGWAVWGDGGKLTVVIDQQPGSSNDDNASKFRQQEASASSASSHIDHRGLWCGVVCIPPHPTCLTNNILCCFNLHTHTCSGTPCLRQLLPLQPPCQRVWSAACQDKPKVQQPHSDAGSWLG